MAALGEEGTGFSTPLATAYHQHAEPQTEALDEEVGDLPTLLVAKQRSAEPFQSKTAILGKGTVFLTALAPLHASQNGQVSAVLRHLTAAKISRSKPQQVDPSLGMQFF